MSSQLFFTQQQIDEARAKLESLPDLSPSRMTKHDALENLRATILVMAKEKGYTVRDIKSALDSMKFVFSERAISELIREDSGGKKRMLAKRKKRTETDIS